MDNKKGKSQFYDNIPGTEVPTRCQKTVLPFLLFPSIRDLHSVSDSVNLAKSFIELAFLAL